ncbi:PH domain-containing protein [Gilvimarinus agarilyticus]|uniref:PH domain-containing protein n=1 Tax=unclassified Gilvimarinus TaxID=2642066 RepID=UPI001C099A50|nr:MULTISPECIES: PH domain-containing protein [unclassified Gilvimarinus]MBU2884419.1 PH domain-containing protein [Gilvimarinus agarilyticus]MDO6569555.1 PH domain-containing protein [Gilvimarinus sp. 2_MG-2023]MDO6748120.1 PH domain-containing protein [Gilvimarinus sp. 1_MG-2023]
MKELYAANPVMFKNNPLGFIATLILCLVGIGFIIFLVWHLKNKSSRLVVTDEDVLFEQGLLSKERSELNIKSIRTVKVKQSFWNRVFGTGTIELYTAGDSPEIVAKGLPDPNTVRDIIKAND